MHQNPIITAIAVVIAAQEAKVEAAVETVSWVLEQSRATKDYPKKLQAAEIAIVVALAQIAVVAAAVVAAVITEIRHLPKLIATTPR